MFLYSFSTRERQILLVLEFKSETKCYIFYSLLQLLFSRRCLIQTRARKEKHSMSKMLFKL